MKVIVILTLNVKLALDVLAAHLLLDSIQIYIVAHKEDLIMENGIFAQLITHVG